MSNPSKKIIRLSLLHTGDLLRIGLAAMLMPISTAYAYVDPGTGSLLIQGLLALIGTLVVFFRNPIASIKSFVARMISSIRKK